MSYTIVYSDYNGYPGSDDTYDHRSGVETPILPDVNLYNSFNFKLYATTANSVAPSTQEDGAGDYNRSSNYRTSGYRSGSSTRIIHQNQVQGNLFSSQMLMVMEQDEQIPKHLLYLIGMI